MVTRAQIKEQGNTGVTPTAIELNRRLLLADAAADLATAQAAVSGLGSALEDARDNLDTQLV